MKLVILFFGLIVHVNQPWSLDNTAVLPDAEHHHPVMSIPKSALAVPDDPWLKGSCANDPCVVKLKGFNVRVKGTRGWFSKMSPELIAALPSLKDLAPGCRGLRKEVRDRVPLLDELASFVDYRGGRRSVETYYKQKAAFEDGPQPWKDPRCLTCKLRYEAELDGSEITLTFTEKSTGKTHDVRIKGDSTLEVTHIPDKYDPGHFGFAYNIFEPDERCVGLSPMVYPDKLCDNYCDTGNTAVSTASPFPQADCTNTGYP
jgi:hypothetical protein